MTGDTGGSFTEAVDRVDRFSETTGRPFDVWFCLGKVFDKSCNKSEFTEESNKNNKDILIKNHNIRLNDILNGRRPINAKLLVLYDPLFQIESTTNESVLILRHSGQIKVLKNGLSFALSITENDSKKLVGFNDGTPLDILITKDWPSGICRYSQKADRDMRSLGVDHVSNLYESGHLTPRYHFSYGENCFFEREPFKYLNPLGQTSHVGRFISLAYYSEPYNIAKSNSLDETNESKPLNGEKLELNLVISSNANDALLKTLVEKPSVSDDEKSTKQVDDYSENKISAATQKRSHYAFKIIPFKTLPTEILADIPQKATDTPFPVFQDDVTMNKVLFLNQNIQRLSPENTCSSMHSKKLVQNIPPDSYKCFKCGLVNRHFIHDCPLTGQFSRGEEYICKRCGIPGHHIRECGLKMEGKISKANGECWFCLANPGVRRNLILSIEKDHYLAAARGGLTENHLVIVAIDHVDSNLKNRELNVLQKRLEEKFLARGLLPVFFSINPCISRDHHWHQQCLPIPMEKIKDFTTFMMQYIPSQGFSCTLESSGLEKNDQNDCEYGNINVNKFSTDDSIGSSSRLLISDDCVETKPRSNVKLVQERVMKFEIMDQIILVKVSKNSFFPAQLGRQAMGEFLLQSDIKTGDLRALAAGQKRDWRMAALPDEEENAIADALRKIIN